mgnify:CR=1 FL=1
MVLSFPPVRKIRLARQWLMNFFPWVNRKTFRAASSYSPLTVDTLYTRQPAKQSIAIRSFCRAPLVMFRNSAPREAQPPKIWKAAAKERR